MVICHSTQASVRETSHDREYKCTIKVRRKTTLGKTSLSCLLVCRKFGTHTNTQKKYIICPQNTKKHSVISLAEVWTDPEGPGDDFRGLRFVVMACVLSWTHWRRSYCGSSLPFLLNTHTRMLHESATDSSQQMHIAYVHTEFTSLTVRHHSIQASNTFCSHLPVQHESANLQYRPQITNTTSSVWKLH